MTGEPAILRGSSLYRPAISDWLRATIRRCNSRTVSSPSGAVGRCDLAHPLQRMIMIDGFEMVAQRFAADGDPVLDDLGRFAKRERVSLDGVRGIGQLDVIMLLQLREGGGRQRA